MKALRTAAGKKQGRLKRKGPDGFLAESWDKREQRTGARGVNSVRRFLLNGYEFSRGNKKNCWTLGIMSRKKPGGSA